MALFRKKKKSSKDLKLPEAPIAFPELPLDDSEETYVGSGLPTLPKLPALKSLSTFPQFSPVERHESMAVKMPSEMHSAQEFPDIPSDAEEEEGGSQMIMKRKEPVFVKIDKFRDAMANFELIKKKIQETSDLLDKIKDARKREEEELNAWAQELESIKQKISSIDKKVFSSLE